MDDSTPDPFGGIPMFGDLARMLSQQAGAGWDAARQLAISVATDNGAETNVDPLERMAFEPLARVAELHIVNATGLDVTTTGLTIVPVTRGEWAARTLEAWRPLLDALTGSLTGTEAAEPDPADPMGFLAPLMRMVAPMMLGMTAGSMVGHLARRAFGQYDLPIPRTASDELMVVPANIAEFASDWSLPIDDLRMWVCLQEVATHAVLRVPHVRTRLDSFMTQYAAGFEPDSGDFMSRFENIDPTSPEGGFEALFSDPELMLGAMRSDAQRALLPAYETLVATIVGYVDHLMDTVGVGLLTRHSMIAEAIRRRRVETDASDRFVERLFGLELTQATVDRGEAFVRGVLERSDEATLSRVWESDETLPTPAELDAPGLWLARLEFTSPAAG